VEAVVNGLTRTTPVIKDTLNPVWNCSFAYFVQKRPDVIDFHLFDEDDHGKNDSLGDVQLDIKGLWDTGKTFEGDLPVIYKKQQKGTLHVRANCRVMHPVQTEKRLVETEGKLEQSEEEKKKIAVELQTKEGELERKFGEIMALTSGKSELKAKFDQMIDQMAEAEVRVKRQDEEIASLRAALKAKEAEAKAVEEKAEAKKAAEAAAAKPAPAAAASAAAAPVAKELKDKKDLKEEPSEKDFLTARPAGGPADPEVKGPGKFVVRVELTEGKGLRKAFLLGDADPFAELSLDDGYPIRSKVHKGLDPKFAETLQLFVEGDAPKQLKVVVKDESKFAKAGVIGSAVIPLATLWAATFDGTVDLVGPKGLSGKLTLKVTARELPPSAAQ